MNEYAECEWGILWSEPKDIAGTVTRCPGGFENASALLAFSIFQTGTVVSRTITYSDWE